MRAVSEHHFVRWLASDTSQANIHFPGSPKLLACLESYQWHNPWAALQLAPCLAGGRPGSRTFLLKGWSLPEVYCLASKDVQEGPQISPRKGSLQDLHTKRNRRRRYERQLEAPDPHRAIPTARRSRMFLTCPLRSFPRICSVNLQPSSDLSARFHFFSSDSLGQISKNFLRLSSAYL